MAPVTSGVSRVASLAALLVVVGKSAAGAAVDDDVAQVLASNGGEADEVCDGITPEECDAAYIALKQLRGIRRHQNDAEDVLNPSGGPGPKEGEYKLEDGDLGAESPADAASKWTPWSEDLGKPSTAPLYTFYMYRAVSDETYDPINVNMANLPGVLWYLHHEVVVQYPRKFEITSIERFQVQMRATEPLVKKGMHFGPRMAMDRGQATGPFVCGRQERGDGGMEPSFCDGPFDAASKGKEIIAANGKSYNTSYEYGRYGFHVGCNNLGEYPFPMYEVYYPKSVWYTLPGACPSKTFDTTDPACVAQEPGGLCEGEPTGTGDCTWNYKYMGKVSIDDLVDVPVSQLAKSGGREYDPFTDKGIKTNFWDGINTTEANAKRIKALRKLFAEKFPDQALDEEMPSPPCDFDFGKFYKEFWWKAPFAGKCQDAKAGDECYDMAKWGKTDGIYSHPEYYPGLTEASTLKEFQQLLYMQGKAACPHRPCGIIDSDDK